MGGCARTIFDRGRRIVEQAPTVLDVVISLLQSMVVLLLASGVYVALAVRKTDD
jgi:hypothetical protein